MMKKLLLIALMGGMLTADAVAQMTGGGSYAQEQRRAVNNDVFANRTYLHAGTLAASGRYGTMPQTGMVYFDAEAAEEAFAEGSGATKGYFGALTRLQYLNTDLHPMIGLGLQYGLSAGYVQVDWKGIQEWDELEAGVGDLIADVRIGPLVSVNPVDKLLLDVSVQLGYGMSGGSYLDAYELPLNDGGRADVFDESGATFGMSRSFGLGVRYSAFSLGWELHSVGGTRTRSYTYSYSDANYENFADGEFEYDVKTRAATSRLYIGIGF